ncbi:MAG: Proline--tRNA ligase [Candidatus Peribacteria bacterium]|nr:Proline--tRNA ligase [Candidatus Peribacteria bacterium]
MPPEQTPADDFLTWYNDLVIRTELAEPTEITGCNSVKPYGYAIWEFMQRDLDRRIQELDVKNMYFPSIMPALLAEQKNAGTKNLPDAADTANITGTVELLHQASAGETLICTSFAGWIRTYRDLPLRINQWTGKTRPETSPVPFLRDTEFLFQEGLTAHTTEEEASDTANLVQSLYKDFMQEILSIPVVSGRKPAHTTRQGADTSYTNEALSRNGKAIQLSACHLLSRGFSQAYDIRFQNAEGQTEQPFFSNWSTSMRLIGAVIMVHADDNGLRLPPAVAPVQIVIVPMTSDAVMRDKILEKSVELRQKWPQLRVTTDNRENVTEAIKSAEWERKGVPIRIEIAADNMQQDTLAVIRRDTGETQTIRMESCSSSFLDSLLAEIQGNMFREATLRLQDHTYECHSFEEMNNYLTHTGGFLWAPWDGLSDTATRIHDATHASILLVEQRENIADQRDILSGNPAKYMALFAMSL